MPNFAVVDMEGKQVGSIDLSESVFGVLSQTQQLCIRWL